MEAIDDVAGTAGETPNIGVIEKYGAGGDADFGRLAEIGSAYVVARISYPQPYLGPYRVNILAFGMQAPCPGYEGVGV